MTKQPRSGIQPLIYLTRGSGYSSTSVGNDWRRVEPNECWAEQTISIVATSVRKVQGRKQERDESPNKKRVKLILLISIPGRRELIKDREEKEI